MPATTTTPTNETASTPLAALLADFMPEIKELGMDSPASAPASQESETEEELTEEETTETDPTEETEADAEEETEEEETEDDEEEQPKSKEWPDSARKRVDKLTAKLRAAEAERETARKELEKLQQEQGSQPAAKEKPASSTDASLLDDVWDESALNQRASQALAWKQWAIENPDGGTLTINGQTREYSHEDVRRIAINSDRMLNLEIPNRKEFLQKAISYENGLRQHFPEYFDTSKPEWQEVTGALATIPALKARPDAMGLAIMLSMGLKKFQEVVQSKAKPAATAAPKAKKPPLAPKLVTPTATTSKSPSSSKSKSLDAVIAAGGDLESLESYFNQ